MSRFKLVAHFETRTGPIFRLVLTNPQKTSPQLRPHADGASRTAPPQFGPGALSVGKFPGMCYSPMTLQFVKNGETQITFGARDLTMQQIANDIVDALTADLNRPVVDATGLTGNFDFVMNFVQETAQPGDSDGLAFVEALKDQLGLKLESGTGSIETLMIGHIAEPSPN